MVGCWAKARSLLGITVLGLAKLVGCAQENIGYFQGYVEGEYVRVAAPLAGRLIELAVARGDWVNPGKALYTLEHDREESIQAEALARLRRAEARLEDLRKGKRLPELQAIEAQLAQAKASLKLSEARLQRQENLIRPNFISEDALDEARARYKQDQARVTELSAQLTTARLAARSDEIAAAEAEVEAAQAALAQAQWGLAQKLVKTPVGGRVTDTLYVQGEWIAAGAPVVEILPPGNIKIRFFIPEPELGGVRLGQPVRVYCDGCKSPLRARITFISPQAEYTPPVIYSKDSRSKLVFLVEAQPAADQAMALHPGQPVDVSLLP